MIPSSMESLLYSGPASRNPFQFIVQDLWDSGAQLPTTTVSTGRPWNSGFQSLQPQRARPKSGPGLGARTGGQQMC